MKTAISIPDDLFHRAERLAQSAGKSRSELDSAAVREYVARHAPDDVTEAIDSVVAELGEGAAPVPFVAEAARRRLMAADW